MARPSRAREDRAVAGRGCQETQPSLLNDAREFIRHPVDSRRGDGDACCKRQRHIIEDRSRHLVCGRSRRPEGVPRAEAPPLEVMPDPFFHRARLQEMDGVNASLLSQAVDATHPLLEAKRIPGQLQVDDQSAPSMEVQALAGGVGGQQDVDLAARELPEHFLPHGDGQAAVD